MSEIERIYDQLSRSYRGPAWHGPSVTEVLQGIDADKARRDPGFAHSIWQVALHIRAWEAITILALAGETFPDDPALPPEEDWPAISGTWEETLGLLERTHNELEAAVLQFPEERLEEKVKGDRDFTFYFLLHGVIQHNIYHAGQTALLRKSA
jgi:uncharacterized damage-inducible protein DinB